MLDARDAPKHMAPFARDAMLANFAPVVAKHMVHIVACEPHDQAPVLPLTRPLLNTQGALDACTPRDLVHMLNARPDTIATVVSVHGRGRAEAAQRMHALLCTRAPDTHVPIKELAGAHYKPSNTVEVLASGTALLRCMRQEGHGTDLTRADSPVLPAATPAQADPEAHAKIMLLQQQQSTMSHNLENHAARHLADPLRAGKHLQGQMLEQIRQQRTSLYSRSLGPAPRAQEPGGFGACRPAGEF